MTICKHKVLNTVALAMTSKLHAPHTNELSPIVCRYTYTYPWSAGRTQRVKRLGVFSRNKSTYIYIVPGPCRLLVVTNDNRVTCYTDTKLELHGESLVTFNVIDSRFIHII